MVILFCVKYTSNNNMIVILRDLLIFDNLLVYYEARIKYKLNQNNKTNAN